MTDNQGFNSYFCWNSGRPSCPPPAGSTSQNCIFFPAYVWLSCNISSPTLTNIHTVLSLPIQWLFCECTKPDTCTLLAYYFVLHQNTENTSVKRTVALDARFILTQSHIHLHGEQSLQHLMNLLVFNLYLVLKALVEVTSAKCQSGTLLQTLCGKEAEGKRSR